MVSDLVYFIVYYIIGYRKKVVTSNLKLVFPEKSEQEITQIKKKFYAHMCDMFLEMIKSISISKEEMKKRFVFKNPEEVKRLENLNKSFVLMCGHYASYEWVIALQLYDVKYQAYGIYKKIKNRHFDKMARDIRGRFKGILVPTVEATSTIKRNQREGNLGIYAMVADQSPKKNRAKYWMDFMDHKVPVFMGSEKLARELDMAVVYLHVEKVKRGHYEATLKTICDSPKELSEFEISKKYFELLESQIREKPEFYLWTHKRWKFRNGPIPANAVIID